MEVGQVGKSARPGLMASQAGMVARPGSKASQAGFQLARPTSTVLALADATLVDSVPAVVDLVPAGVEKLSGG